MAAQRRTLGVLMTSQGFGGSGITVGIAAAALLAEDLTGSQALAGMAQTVQVLASAFAAYWLAGMMRLHGRRRGLVTGYACGAVGAVASAAAAMASSFPLLLAGSAFLGFTTAANGLARYTAVDLARPSVRGRSLAMVVWATTIGAVAGPSLTGPTASVAARVGLEGLSGPFLFGLATMLVALVTLAVLLRPDPLHLAWRETGHSPRIGARGASWAAVRAAVAARPAIGAGIATMALAHAVMVAVMVMTPLHMRHGGAGLDVIGFTISGHVFGMFGLSPLVGWASDRLGAPRVMAAGAVVLVAAAAIAGGAPAGAGPSIAIGLFVLGVGWSLATVSSAALIAAHAPDGARTDVQGAGDLVMGLAAAAAGAFAGVVMAVSSFMLLNAFAGSLALAALACAWAARRFVAQASPAAAA